MMGARMRVAIIGAGHMGRILARRLVELGHAVSIANSKGPESLAALAAEIGAAPARVGDASKAADMVILAIPTKSVPDLPRALFANAPRDAVVIDIGNYHPELRDGRIEEIDRGMLDSEWVARQIGRPVIKAFNNILAASLADKGVAKGTKGRIALSVMGDSAEAKAIVLGLVDDLGFDPVDGGELASSWRQQPGTPAYCRDLDAAALQRALAEADRRRIGACRAEREAQIRREIAAQTNGGDDLIVPPDVVYVTYIKTTPEKVWEALTSAEFSRKMFFGLAIESDWTMGARWAFLSPDGSVHDEGEVLEADPPRRLKLSWRVVFLEEARKLSPAFITYEIEPLGEAVRLTMIQHQPKPIPRKFHEGGKQGWPLILSILKSVLETGEGFTVEMKPPASSQQVSGEMR